MPLTLNVEGVSQDWPCSLGVAEGREARALVVAEVQAVAVEVHAVPALLGTGPVDGCIGRVLRLVERPNVAKAGVGSGLKRPSQACVVASVLRLAWCWPRRTSSRASTGWPL